MNRIKLLQKGLGYWILFEIFNMPIDIFLKARHTFNCGLRMRFN